MRKFVPASALIADSVDSLGGYGETETVDLILERRKLRCDGGRVAKKRHIGMRKEQRLLVRLLINRQFSNTFKGIDYQSNWP